MARSLRIREQRVAASEADFGHHTSNRLCINPEQTDNDGSRPVIPTIVPILAFALPVITTTPEPELLQQGFDSMYNLSFLQAHEDFQTWERKYPDDPRGPVFDAAAYLFSEFDRLKILQSEFFVDDQTYEGLSRRIPDPKIRRDFEKALDQSRHLAEARLRRSPNDIDARFANVLRLGLHADYLALIQKQNLAALSEVKQATQSAEELVKLCPDCYDAYIAIGIENYLLSLKPAPIRWLLHATGAQTDRQVGIEKLKLTATRGVFLKPYAQILLAMAALRQKDVGEARRLLADLGTRYPRNPLYRNELDKIR